MELPIMTFPTYIEEMSEPFKPHFQQGRQFKHFKRVLTGFPIAEKNTLAHMNGLFTFHTNQSNFNRFVTKSNWDPNSINRTKIQMLNQIENNGIVILDDYIVPKSGKEIFGVDWHHDHAKGKKIWGHQVADCILSGRGIYPLLSSIYVKRKSKWLNGGFKTKIDLQKNHLDQLVEMDLNFSCVTMDSWYFCKKLVKHIEGLNKDWVAQSKSNRLIKFHGEWISLKDFAKIMINEVDFRVIELGDDKYFMKAFTVNMKNMGKVRFLVSLNKHGKFHFYVSNRLDWNELAIVSRYSRRWDIEVWHREGKGSYGLEDCQLRSGDAVSRYLTLSALAAVLLEIASMLSPVYADLKTRGCTPELKHRWVLTEIVGQLISYASKIQDIEVRRVIENILCPYKSTITKGVGT